MYLSVCIYLYVSICMYLSVCIYLYVCILYVCILYINIYIYSIERERDSDLLTQINETNCPNSKKKFRFLSSPIPKKSLNHNIFPWPRRPIIHLHCCHFDDSGLLEVCRNTKKTGCNLDMHFQFTLLMLPLWYLSVSPLYLLIGCSAKSWSWAVKQPRKQQNSTKEKCLPISNKKRKMQINLSFKWPNETFRSKYMLQKKMADSPHIRHKISNAGMALLGHTAIRQQTTRPYVTLQSCNSSSLVSLQSVSFRQLFGGSLLFIHEGTKQIWPTWRILERLCALERYVVACYVYIKKMKCLHYEWKVIFLVE